MAVKKTTAAKDKPTPVRPGSGRKPKIGDVERQQVLGVLSVGGSLSDAAAVINVDVSTLRRLKSKDAEFARGVRKAVRAGKVRLLQKIGKATHWQAAKWMLERRWGKNAGKRSASRDEAAPAGRGAEVEFTLEIGPSPEPAGGTPSLPTASEAPPALPAPPEPGAPADP